MQGSELMTIRTYLNSLDAEMAKGLLEAAGIAAMVKADDCGGMRPHMQLQGVELIIRTGDAETALGILDGKICDDAGEDTP